MRHLAACGCLKSKNIDETAFSAKGLWSKRTLDKSDLFYVALWFEPKKFKNCPSLEDGRAGTFQMKGCKLSFKTYLRSRHKWATQYLWRFHTFPSSGIFVRMGFSDSSKFATQRQICQKFLSSGAGSAEQGLYPIMPALNGISCSCNSLYGCVSLIPDLLGEYRRTLQYWTPDIIWLEKKQGLSIFQKRSYLNTV